MNEHVTEYLNEYVNHPKSPGFGVMLNGKWGAGKTYFIKEFIKGNPESKFYYISLYGIKNISAIDQEFYKLIHPILSNNKMKLLGRFFKGSFKIATRVDLDGDGKDDASISIQAPDVDFDRIKLDSYPIIIFDDVERCEMPINEVLGYINSFVEHENVKVIVCANEEQILSSEENYKRVKEKLIGKTLEIKPSIDDAIASFIEDLPEDSKLRDKLHENRDLIIEIFNVSEIANLRVLKTAFYDLDNLMRECSENIFNHKSVIADVIANYLSLHLEIHCGNLTSIEVNYSDTEKTHSVMSKYEFIEYIDFGAFSLRFSPIPISLWQKTFSRSGISREEFAKNLENSDYFRGQNEPMWLKLYNFRTIAASEFDVYIDEAESKFEEHDFTELGEVFHLAGIFLRLSKEELIETDTPKIVEIVKASIENLYMTGKVTIIEPDWNDDFITYQNRSFQSRDSAAFGEILECYNEQRELLIKSERVKSSLKIIDGLKKADLSIISDLTNRSLTGEWTEPILQEIDLVLFLPILKNLSTYDLYRFFNSIARRYSEQNCYEYYSLELDWLKKLEQQIIEWSETDLHKLTKWQIGSANKELLRAISKLEESKLLEDKLGVIAEH